MNYYNEFDPKAAEWLRVLIRNKLIPEGHVDTRSITEVRPDELTQYTQCHFFAGVAGWSKALELANVPPDTPLWTGSCPCQPFSAAGKQKGTADERHLWPVLRDLIAECRPPAVLGEQVASKAGRAWLATVRSEMEELGYAVGASDLCAAGVGAPHIRQRLWFGAVRLADANSERRRIWQPRSENADNAASTSETGRLADTERGRLKEQRVANDLQSGQRPTFFDASGDGPTGRLADADAGGQSLNSQQRGREALEEGGEEPRHDADRRSTHDRTPPPDPHWGAADWLFCRDGKWRPVEPRTFPLAYGIPGRVGLLRGYGNAIVPPLAAVFIEAFLESTTTLA